LSIAEELLDHRLVDIPAAHLGVPARRPDDPEAMVQIRLQCRRIVGAHEGEDLLVAVRERSFERRFEQLRRDPCRRRPRST